MLRTCTFLVMLVILAYSSVQPGLLDENSPLYLEKTEKLSTWEYEIVSWNPVVVDNVLWLLYDELTWGNETILKYMVYDSEWSSPETLSDNGEFAAAVEEGGALTLFWNEAVRGESGISKTICFKTFDGEWSPSSCSETGQYAGRQFVVKMPDGTTWLLWSRWGFWEYQVLLEDQWGSPQVLTTTEEYDEILEVLVGGETVWIFYKTGSSDLSYRVLQKGVLSEPDPLVTEGFPYLYDVLLYNGEVLVFLEVQDVETDSKTMVYTAYNGNWSPLRAVAAPEDGYLAGGSAVRVSDGRVFLFWNGTDTAEQPQGSDIFYRVYNGTWSVPYRLTDTPDAWETSPTATEYEGNLIIIWRDKESHVVSASHISVRDVPIEEAGELRLVTPKTEPIPPKWNPWLIKMKEYSYLIIMAVVLAGFAALVYLKRRLSSGEEPKKTESAKEKSKKRKESRKKK